MTFPSFEIFQADALANGFDEVVVRTYTAGAVVPTHTHPFDADALVTEGEMWLTLEGEARHLLPGGTFIVPRNTPHDERSGADGATYWVRRRNGNG